MAAVEDSPQLAHYHFVKRLASGGTGVMYTKTLAITRGIAGSDVVVMTNFQ